MPSNDRKLDIEPLLPAPAALTRMPWVRRDQTALAARSRSTEAGANPVTARALGNVKRCVGLADQFREARRAAVGQRIWKPEDVGWFD